MSVLLLASALVLAGEPAELVGEWAPDYEICKRSRVVYLADGQTMAIALEDDIWEPLGAGRYQLEGDRLTEEVDGETQELLIDYLDEYRLVLRLADPDQAVFEGVVEAEFVRCPEREP